MNDLFETSTKEVLGESTKNKNLLELDGDLNSKWVRCNDSTTKESQSAQAVGNIKQQSSTEANREFTGVPPLRQQKVCTPESLVSGNTFGQYAGCEEKEQTEESVSKRRLESLQERPLTSNERKLETENLCEMPEGSESRVPAKATTKPQVLQAKESGILVGSTLEEQYRLAQYYTKSGLMPKALNTPEKVLVALQLCFEHGLPPMSSVGKICVISQTPSFFGELPLALVRKSGKLKSIKEITFDSSGKEICRQNNNLDSEISGAECFTERVDGSVVTTTFTVKDAQKAQLWGKSGPWTLYPKDMLMYRARSRNLKSNFSDVLLGISIAEYDYNYIPGVDDEEKTLSHQGQLQLTSDDVINKIRGANGTTSN